MYIHELLEKKSSLAVNTISPDCTLLEMAAVFSKKKTTCLVVEDDFSDMIGLVTERDLVHAVNKHPAKISSTTISEIMTTDVITCGPEDDVVETLNKMSSHRVRHMPVVKDGNLLAVVEITDFQIICDHLGVLATTDPLTGLANRRQFTESMNVEFSRFKRGGAGFSYAALDIDHFKSINDTHGHNAGDMILCRFADIFQTNLRDYDLAARIGGEEFGILFPNTNLDQAKIACTHVLEKIRSIELVHDIGIIKCTASFGLTTISDDIPDIEAMMNYSDQLLYQAKGEGRNQIIATPWFGYGNMSGSNSQSIAAN